MIVHLIYISCHGFADVYWELSAYTFYENLGIQYAYIRFTGSGSTTVSEYYVSDWTLLNDVWFFFVCVFTKPGLALIPEVTLVPVPCAILK